MPGPEPQGPGPHEGQDGGAVSSARQFHKRLIPKRIPHRTRTCPSRPASPLRPAGSLEPGRGARSPRCGAAPVRRPRPAGGAQWTVCAGQGVVGGGVGVVEDTVGVPISGIRARCAGVPLRTRRTETETPSSAPDRIPVEEGLNDTPASPYRPIFAACLQPRLERPRQSGR